MITDKNQQEFIDKADELIKLMTGCKPVVKTTEEGALEISISYVDKFVFTRRPTKEEIPEHIRIFALASGRLLLLQKVIEFMKDPVKYVEWCRAQQFYLQTMN